MSNNRIVYQNWIVDIGHDPDDMTPPAGTGESLFGLISLDDPRALCLTDQDVRKISNERARVELIRSHVTQALNQLSEDESEFLIRFYFIGESYRQISEKSGRSVHKLEAIHKRGIRKLRRSLASFVQETFNVRIERQRDCPICRSPFLSEINRLIEERDKTTTWKPVLRVLRERYGLHVASPQLLLGHEKYH